MALVLAVFRPGDLALAGFDAEDLALGVLAAGAGALRIRLGGDENYGGKLKHRVILGKGERVSSGDISRSLTLLNRSIMIFLVVVALVELAIL